MRVPTFVADEIEPKVGRCKGTGGKCGTEPPYILGIGGRKFGEE